MNVNNNQFRVSLIEDGTINYSDSLINNIENLKINLKEHQIRSYNKMVDLEKCQIQLNNDASLSTSVGIYSDTVGSGKSLTILALLSNNNTLKSECKHYVFTNKICLNVTLRNENICNINLIVVPHAITKQWEEYITDYTYLQYHKIHNVKEYNNFVDNFSKYKEYVNVVLISCSYYNNLINELNTVTWKRVIFDEADSINIPGCAEPNTLFTWLVTSSLQNLLFSQGFYYLKQYETYNGQQVLYNKRFYLNGIRKNGYIKDISRGLESVAANTILKSIIIKNKDDYVRECFKIPDYNKKFVPCYSPSYINILFGSVSKEILSMLNAGNKEGAIELLGCKVDTQQNIIDVINNNNETMINNLNNQLTYYNSINCITRAQEEMKNRNIEKTKNEILKLEEKISNIKDKFNDYKSEMCPICIDNLKDPTVCVQCCKNLFCMQCISQSLSIKNTCPMCRTPINKDSCYVIQDKVHKKVTKKPTKLEALVNIVNNNEKILIFSSYDQTFAAIEVELQKNNIKYGKISGNTNVINSNISKYKSGEYKVLMLNSSHYGSGINLECTSDLIFFHKMTQDLETQVIGRAHRYGRMKPLNIHILCYENELKNT